MTDKEQDKYFIKTLNAALQLYKEGAEYEKQNPSRTNKKISEDYEEHINFLETILKQIKTIDDLGDLGEDAITEAFEAIAAYAECFIISADERQRKLDLQEYEKIEELIYLFCDSDEEDE